MKEILEKRGFSLIELLIVISILSLLVAIAIPSYLGIREKSRIGVYKASAKSVINEIQAWGDATSTNFLLDLRELDTNCDGNITDSDLTTGELIAAGIANVYVSCRNTGYNEISPWFSEKKLWTTNTSNYNGQIQLLDLNHKITIIARGKNGQIVFEELIRY